FRAVQIVYAIDHDPICPRAFDLCAHFVEEIGQVHDLGFACCSFNDRHADGQHGCHHHVVCAEHCRTECDLHVDLCPAQFGRENFDVAAFHAYGRAERFEAFQMQINRPITDHAAAEQRHACFLAPTQQ